MGKHLVCLTFDFDAMSGMVAKGLKSPTAISRGEFGAVAVDRILALLKKNAIPTSWFIPGTVIKTYGDGREVWKNALDARRPVRHVFRHEADPKSVLDHFPSHRAALRGQPEIVFRQRESQLVQAGQQPARAVESDEYGLRQVAGRTGPA